MQITAVRHGETNENVAGIVQGQTLGTLSDLGRQQILKVAEKLQDEVFDVVYCSDLERCVQTAEAIMKYHQGTPLVYDKRLRERRLDSIAGKYFKDIGWATEELQNITLKLGDDESWSDVRSRLVPFVEFLKTQPGQKVLLVTHGGPMRAFDSILNMEPLEESFKRVYENCEVRRWEI